MLKFTSADDLARLPEDNPAHPIISDLVRLLITETFKTDYPYDPESDGFIALVEPGDVGRPLTEIWDDGEWGLTDIPWEGITLRGDFYHAIFLANNQYGIIFIIPQDLVLDDLLELFEEILDPPLNEIQQSLL